LCPNPVPVVSRLAELHPAGHQAGTPGEKNRRAKPHLPVGQDATREQEWEREAEVGGDSPGSQEERNQG
jgi:hypothetical protein